MDTRSEFIVRGTNSDEAIKFVSLPEISRSSYDISISFRTYEVAETSVTLFEPDRFVQDFIDLEQSRSGAARLSGTYDFEMNLSPYEHRGDVLVSFVLGNTLATASGREGYCRIKGDFVLQGDWVLNALHGMKALLGSGD